MDPFNPSVNIFGEILISLHDKNFSPATVEGYCSAISTALTDFKCGFLQSIHSF